MPQIRMAQDSRRGDQVRIVRTAKAWRSANGRLRSDAEATIGRWVMSHTTHVSCVSHGLWSPRWPRLMDTVGASMPIIIAAAAGMFLATIWAARIGENASAGISCIVGKLPAQLRPARARAAAQLVRDCPDRSDRHPEGVGDQLDRHRDDAHPGSLAGAVDLLAAVHARRCLAGAEPARDRLGVGESDQGSRVGPDGRLRAGRVSLRRRGIPRHRRQGIPAGVGRSCTPDA